MNRILRTVLCILIFASLMSGCFTGVEYTPKVSERDVRRENITSTAEDTLLANVTDEPLADWQPGKLFYVTNNKIHLIFGATASPRDTLGGRTLEFVSAKESPSIVGTSVTDLTFRAADGRRYTYRINRPIASVMEQGPLSVPFTIQKTLVDSAARILDGRQLYVLTRTWRDDNDNSVNGRQFVAVKIDSVVPGNDIYPIKIAFTDTEGTSARLFIHPGPRGHTPRSFPAMFSFTDPRLRYPSITDATWDNIMRGRIAHDMTREECRLALGAPREVDRGADNSFVREVWLYDNGIYLVFEDGLLKTFRR